MSDSHGPIAQALATIVDGTASHFWPMLVVPAIAAIISDRAARRLPPTRADWRVAALLAASPGLAMLTIMAMIFARAIEHLELEQDLPHFIKYHGSAIVAGGLLAFASIRTVRQHRQVRRVTELATAPCPKLAAAAAAASVRVQEIAGDSCEIFVAGLFRPTVYVSSGALRRMGDEELRAALHHEAAHVANRDPALFTVLAFLRCLAPSTDRARLAFIQARERSADAEAARSVGQLALASALIAAVKPAPPALPVPGMGGSGPPDWRLRAILGVEPAERGGPRTSLKVWGGLAASLMLTGWPAGQIYVGSLLCTCG
jgi:Zn-dependent protease with chaperone function